MVVYCVLQIKQYFGSIPITVTLRPCNEGNPLHVKAMRRLINYIFQTIHRLGKHSFCLKVSVPVMDETVRKEYHKHKQDIEGFIDHINKLAPGIAMDDSVDERVRKRLDVIFGVKVDVGE